jgi:hypothetical protein
MASKRVSVVVVAVPKSPVTRPACMVRIRLAQGRNSAISELTRMMPSGWVAMPLSTI